MKKIIALLLAIIMTFSMGTVAFAEGEVNDGEGTTGVAPDVGGEGESEAEPEEETEASDFDWLLDLPFWTVKPALKFAKIALKLVKVYVKLAVLFGVIDKNDIISQIEDLIAGAMGGEEAPEVNENVEPDGDIAVDEGAAAA